MISFINDYEEQTRMWACQHCGKYRQTRWGGLARTRAARGFHLSSRHLGGVWRPDLDALWAHPDPLSDMLGSRHFPLRPRTS
eukprot:117326-Amphidinium_carterae.2